MPTLWSKKSPSSKHEFRHMKRKDCECSRTSSLERRSTCMTILSKDSTNRNQNPKKYPSKLTTAMRLTTIPKPSSKNQSWTPHKKPKSQSLKTAKKYQILPRNATCLWGSTTSLRSARGTFALGVPRRSRTCLTWRSIWLPSIPTWLRYFFPLF